MRILSLIFLVGCSGHGGTIIPLSSVEECIRLCRRDRGVFQLRVLSSTIIKCICNSAKSYQFDETELDDEMDLDGLKLPPYVLHNCDDDGPDSELRNCLHRT